MEKITITRDTPGLGFSFAIGTPYDYPPVPNKPVYFGWDGIQQGWADLTEAMNALPKRGWHYAFRLFLDGRALVTQDFMDSFDEGEANETAYLDEWMAARGVDAQGRTVNR